MTSLYVDEPLVSKAQASAVCEYLDWDSRFFGFKIGRVAGARLDPQRVRSIVRWSQEQSVNCLYFLADVDGTTVHLAEQQGFQLVDIRVTLEARLVDSYSENWRDNSIRAATPEDIPTLREIAGSSYADSRFYQDHHFPRRLCEELYRVWIEKSCQGYANAVLVVEHNARPAGYISCHLKSDSSGQIGLVGVDRNARKLGLGRMLLRRAMSWFLKHDARTVTVVTQGSNVSAQRLYQKSGFLTKGVQLWYHFWPSERREASGAC